MSHESEEFLASLREKIDTSRTIGELCSLLREEYETNRRLLREVADLRAKLRAEAMKHHPAGKALSEEQLVAIESAESYGGTDAGE